MKNLMRKIEFIEEDELSRLIDTHVVVKAEDLANLFLSHLEGYTESYRGVETLREIIESK